MRVPEVGSTIYPVEWGTIEVVVGTATVTGGGGGGRVALGFFLRLRLRELGELAFTFRRIEALRALLLLIRGAALTIGAEVGAIVEEEFGKVKGFDATGEAKSFLAGRLIEAERIATVATEETGIEPAAELEGFGAIARIFRAPDKAADFIPKGRGGGAGNAIALETDSVLGAEVEAGGGGAVEMGIIIGAPL